MTTLFDELSSLWLRLAPAGEKPIQWIYNVDDAWFHPEQWDVKIDGRGPVFHSCLSGKTLPVSLEMVPSSVSNGQQDGPENAEPAAWLRHALSSSDGSAANAGLDYDTLRRLVKFILNQSKEGRIYGLCFCSFEHFWARAKEIDNHLNAVFFDIRHRLALALDAKTVSGEDLQMDKLQEVWDTELSRTDLFTRTKGFSPEQLGWFLHYALKFNRIGAGLGSRPEIGYDHIQILSSAINPILGKADAMSDYVAVQQEIWGGMNGKTDGITSAQFGFSPIPKGQLMDTGLAIFNNSYKDVASWPAMRDLLVKDLLRLWNDDGVCKRGHDAHKATDLCCEGWVIQSDRNDTLRGTHFFYNEATLRNETIGAKSLLKFLQWALLRDDIQLPNGCEDWSLIFPTNPGASYLIGIADLYERMCVLKGCRQKPAVSVLPQNDNCLTIQFKIENDGSVKELKDKADVEPELVSCGQTSAGAYLRLKNGSRVLVHHLDARDEAILNETYHKLDCSKSGCVCNTRRVILEEKWCSDLNSVVADEKTNTISVSFIRGNS